MPRLAFLFLASLRLRESCFRASPKAENGEPTIHRNHLPGDVARRHPCTGMRWSRRFPRVGRFCAARHQPDFGPAFGQRFGHDPSDTAGRAGDQGDAAVGAHLPFDLTTAYINTIPPHRQPSMPGDGAMERRIRSIIRWNAMAMVVRAQARRRIGRPHRQLRLGRHALRRRLQSFLQGPGASGRRRSGLHPGPLVAGHLRARFPRGPASARTSSTASARKSTATG